MGSYALKNKKNDIHKFNMVKNNSDDNIQI